VKKVICEVHRKLPPCPLHGAELQRRDGRYGEFWGCAEYPKCDVTASYSKFDERYHVSNQIVRDSRKLAHALFDRLWQEGHAPRGATYRWLAEKLKIRDWQRNCHIQHFGFDTCCEVVGLCADMLMRSRCRAEEWKLSMDQALYLNLCRRRYREYAKKGKVSLAVEKVIEEVWSRMSAGEHQGLTHMSHEAYQEPIKELMRLRRNGDGRPAAKQHDEARKGEARQGG